jgi:hypothetical protein
MVVDLSIRCDVISSSETKKPPGEAVFSRVQ